MTSNIHGCKNVPGKFERKLYCTIAQEMLFVCCEAYGHHAHLQLTFSRFPSLREAQIHLILPFMMQTKTSKYSHFPSQTFIPQARLILTKLTGFFSYVVTLLSLSISPLLSLSCLAAPEVALILSLSWFRLTSPSFSVFTFCHYQSKTNPASTHCCS